MGTRALDTLSAAAAGVGAATVGVAVGGEDVAAAGADTLAGGEAAVSMTAISSPT